MSFLDKLGEKVANIWDVVSGERRAYRAKLVYSKQIDLQRQLDELNSTINDVERNIIQRIDRLLGV